MSRKRTNDSNEGIDFKPFFDMIVGVLFILLAVIAGQLYHARFHANDKMKEAEAIERQREKRARIELFLTGLGDDLKSRGLTNRVDLRNAQLVMPLASFAEPSEARLVIKAGQAETLANGLASWLPCLATGGVAVAACADRHIGGIAYLGAIMPAGSSAIAGEALALGLRGRIAETWPLVLGLTAPDGQPVFMQAPHGAATGADLAGGIVYLKFDFTVGRTVANP